MKHTTEKKQNEEEKKKELIIGVPEVLHLQYETKCGIIMQLAFVEYDENLNHTYYYKVKN